MNSKRTPACGTATAPSKLDGLALLAAVSEAVLFTHDEPPSTTGKPVLPPLESMATTATTTATKPQKAIPSSHGAVPPLLSLTPYTVSEKLYPNPAVLFEAAMVEPRDTFSQAYKLMTLSHSPVHSPASPTASSLSSTDPASSPQSHFVFDKPTHASNSGNDATASTVSDCACCNHSEAEESDGRAVASSDDEEEEEEDEEYYSDSDAFATSAPDANSAHWPSSTTGSPYPRRVSHRTVRPSPRRHPSPTGAKAEPIQTTPASPTSAIARPSSAAVPILPPIIKRCSNGKKLHVCPYCSREFSCSSNLKRHTSIHTGVKPYRCSTCGMAFSNSSNRRKHERTHAKATKSNTAYSADVPVALSAARLNAPSPSSFPKKPSSNRALRAARRKTGSPRQ